MALATTTWTTGAAKMKSSGATAVAPAGPCPLTACLLLSQPSTCPSHSLPTMSSGAPNSARHASLAWQPSCAAAARERAPAPVTPPLFTCLPVCPAVAAVAGAVGAASTLPTRRALVRARTRKAGSLVRMRSPHSSSTISSTAAANSRASLTRAVCKSSTARVVTACCRVTAERSRRRRETKRRRADANSATRFDAPARRNRDASAKSGVLPEPPRTAKLPLLRQAVPLQPAQSTLLPLSRPLPHPSFLLSHPP